MASAVSGVTLPGLVANVSERHNSTLPHIWSNLHPYQTNGARFAGGAEIKPLAENFDFVWLKGVVRQVDDGFPCVGHAFIHASLTVISVKAVSGMVTSSIQGQLQFQYPIFYVMLVIMIASCIFQVQFLNQAMRLYNATEVVPINFVFFTASAIIAGVIFYQEFHGAALLNIFMFLFGCMLSFLGVFLIAKNREKQTSEVPYIDMGPVPKQRNTEKIQPGLNNINSYGTIHDEEQNNDSPSENVK
ncbi:NIPA-like protein 2 [Rhincodon typus]|uniref:NIPA-like protein 2 n=1 Tax=Rhincodon typus TaxID=259920 RepID=UPI00202F99C0|nr:NIPA-like protein 2 [Rhincodon typus]